MLTILRCNYQLSYWDFGFLIWEGEPFRGLDV